MARPLVPLSQESVSQGTKQAYPLCDKKYRQASISVPIVEAFHVTKGAEFGWVCFQVGFFSGRKKESIFKSPDDHRGKVGVTGSGKGLTDFQRREKHLHLKGGSGDASDDDE